MKIIVNRNELWKGIDTVFDAVSSKPAMPILANLLLKAEGDGLTLLATDLDLSIRTKIPALVSEDGSIAIPARTFAEIVREWPEAEINIEEKEEKILLSGKLGTEEEKGAYSLSGMLPEEFPDMPTSLEGIDIGFGKDDGLPESSLIAEMINKTSFAVSKDETRPVLNGVVWQIDSEGMEMVATDGHRFAKVHHSLDLKNQVKDQEKTEAILPPQVCGHLVKLLGGDDTLEKATLSETQVLFDLGITQLLSRIIEGPYVDYSSVIPKENDKVLRITREKLLPAVRRVSILSSSYTHQIRMFLSNQTLELSANSQETGGEGRELIQVAYEEEDLEIGYNANYLMEILKKINSSEVQFELSNSVTAALLRPGDSSENEDYFCLLMPLRPSG
jgi:DNA polymerase-3 subunit beta